VSNATSAYPQDQSMAGDDRAFTSPSRTVTAADVECFAALTGDRHPQHLDDEWAADSLFGERIAHGMLVLSCAAGLVPLNPERVIALRRCEATFKAPVRFGDQIHVEGAIVGSKPLDDAHSLVTTSWKVVNQSGKTVVRAQVEVVWKAPDDDDGASLGDGPPGVVPL
jgi:3-hydroxybutyryl-CoA dehydratase